MKDGINILAIETSCDETSVSIVRDGRHILSNVISSQIKTHRAFGGVVPEIASRKHLELIDCVVDTALSEANMSFDDISAIATTYGPGLVGALLVGVSYAKAIAYTLKKPLIPVHHIKGHICANYIEHKELKPPFISLIISGGHTTLCEVLDYTTINVIGKTRDDACGEAFDKVARTLGLSYPGGPIVDKLAKTGDKNKINLPRVMINSDDYDFSFSGLKSSVLNFINKCKMTDESFEIPDLLASFQCAISDVLIHKSIKACKEKNINTLTICGGVSANSFLRSSIKEACDKENINLYYPSLELCTDNGAMIASAGYYEYLNKNFADLSLNAYPNIPL